LQTAIVRDLSTQLRPQLGRDERDSLAKVGTKDAEAYRLYLRGRYRFEKFSPEDVTAAAESFEKAVARDSNYAAAFAGLADAYAIAGYLGAISGREPFDKSRTAARRALALDSSIPESHISLALGDFIYFWDFAEAEAEIRRALELDPTYPYAHLVSCWFQLDIGKVENMLNECHRAVDLDPFSSFANWNLAGAYFFARDYVSGLEQAKKSVALDPNSANSLGWLGGMYEAIGNYPQAIEQWRRQAIVKGTPDRVKEIERVFRTSGYTGYLKFDAKYAEGQEDFNIAASDYAMVGDKEAAFRVLERAFVARTSLTFIKIDPSFDNIRSDPRFSALLRRIGLPE
jgi:tetratricopeptide (TPR) repeat protein